MTLDEFKELYETNGEVAAKLVIGEVDCILWDFAQEIPELARYFPTTGAVWGLVLHRDPKMASYCNWNLLDSNCWALLLNESPQYSIYCDWSIIDGTGWYFILSKYPTFHIHCDVNKLSHNQQKSLARKHTKLQHIFPELISDDTII